MNNYKIELFQKALEIEQRLSETTDEKEQKKLMRKFGEYANELYFCGWREEYDLWCQNLRE